MGRMARNEVGRVAILRQSGQTTQKSCCPGRDWEGRGEGGMWRELESDV